MKKVKKFIFSLPFVILIFALLHLENALYYHPHFESKGKDIINTEVLAQLRFLKDELHDGAADKMQQAYPEGFVDLNMLYGLSWCEFAENLSHDSPLYKESLTESHWAYNEIDSEKARRIFPSNQPIPCGAFYAGWRNYLLGKIISLEKKPDSIEINEFRKQSNEIASGLYGNGTPFPDSYIDDSWPGDGTVAVASLALYDKLFEPIYRDTIANWLFRACQHLDSRGMFPHSMKAQNKGISEEGRGSSESLVLNFLFDIDSAFAQQQYRKYHQNFLAHRLGLPGIREYALDASDGGDVDSGPIIFGIGGAASLVGERAAILAGDQTTAIGLRNSIEGFGCAYTSDGKKKFLFGKWPMADAFIVWANALENSPSKELKTGKNWRWQFHLYALSIFILCALPIMRIWHIFPFRQK